MTVTLPRGPRPDDDFVDHPSNSQAATGVTTDTALMERVRGGDLEAFGELYQRHISAAYRRAQQVSHSQIHRDDLVAEAFGAMLNALLGGRGPRKSFRAYLLTTLQNLSYSTARAEHKIKLVEDMTQVETESFDRSAGDAVIDAFDAEAVAKAFATLPEHWRAVLWQTEVEQRSSVQVASELGSTASAVSALAFRARERLRQAYLQQHLLDPAGEQCAFARHLGAWARGTLTRRQHSNIEAHLRKCGECRAAADEVLLANVVLHRTPGRDSRIPGPRGQSVTCCATGPRGETTTRQDEAADRAVDRKGIR